MIEKDYERMIISTEWENFLKRVYSKFYQLGCLLEKAMELPPRTRYNELLKEFQEMLEEVKEFKNLTHTINLFLRRHILLVLEKYCEFNSRFNLTKTECDVLIARDIDGKSFLAIGESLQISTTEAEEIYNIVIKKLLNDRKTLEKLYDQIAVDAAGKYSDVNLHDERIKDWLYYNGEPPDFAEIDNKAAELVFDMQPITDAYSGDDFIGVVFGFKPEEDESGK